MFEIASSIGSPLIIDENTLNIRFDHYAHLSVDLDISEMMFKFVLVEREGFMFNIEVFFYEKHPQFCANCKVIGHGIHQCHKIRSKVMGESKDDKLK